MPTADVHDSDPGRLAGMFDLGKASLRPWQPDELRAVLKHQLSAPVEFDLGMMDAGSAARLKTLAAAQRLLVSSVYDLLHHPQPPIELLEMLKDFARSHRQHRDSPLPAEISTLLYYAAILVARLRCRRRITDLNDAVVVQGVEALIKCDWLDAATRALLQEGLADLTQEPESAQ
ncbi:MAG TPA: hypothetical protein VFC46_00860 [Humisphaera sp.]|nr:hypothetical protein [Humisphaera sp.]